MHAPSRVFWDLGDGYSSLRGSVGIDDSALWNPEDASGSVVFRIKADGEVLWESEEIVRGGDGVIPIPARSLEGVSELVLEADMVQDFRGDRANWLHVVLVK